MAIPYHADPSSATPHLRLVGEERASYDASPRNRDVDWVKHHAAIRAILGTYKGSEYKVYAFLDSWCNEHNQTWVGIERICDGVLLKERQVQSLLATLERDGWIIREPRYNEFGMQSGVTYTLPHRMPQKAHDSGGAVSGAETHAECDAITYATDCTQVNTSNSQVNTRSDEVPSENAVALLTAYAEAVGIRSFSRTQREKNLARTSELDAMGITPDDIPSLVEFCRGLTWVEGGINLGLMVSQVEGWRTQPKHKTSTDSMFDLLNQY